MTRVPVMGKKDWKTTFFLEKDVWDTQKQNVFDGLGGNLRPPPGNTSVFLNSFWKASKDVLGDDKDGGDNKDDRERERPMRGVFLTF